jgi:hypothetical protein
LAVGSKLRLHIGFHKGRVLLDFGNSISHLEMDPEDAEHVAKLIVKHSQNARVDRALDAATSPVKG